MDVVPAILSTVRPFPAFAGALTFALLLALGGACDDDGDAGGSLTVFAASSLTGAFEEIGSAFEAANPDVSVQFNFAGSPGLRTQLEQGADAGVLVTADEPNMAAALDAGLVVDAGEPFARNRLAIIVPADNPAEIDSIYDLANDGVQLVLAQEGVPIGDYARQSLETAGEQPDAGDGFAQRALSNVVSEEPSVKAVVTKIQLGEADAGIVYVTDVTEDIAGHVSMIEIPDALNVVARYPIAITTNAAQPEIARTFTDFVLSEQGQTILAALGFMTIE